MRSLLLFGAVTGLAIGVILGLLNRSDWPSILWRSMLAALSVGVLLRWWGQRWAECLRAAQQERFAKMLEPRQEPEEPRKAPATRA
jgi:hypothetical protein